jgi:hypothetical protein
MILRYQHLSNHAKVFLAMTGLQPSEFVQLVREVKPLYEQAELARKSRPGRKRQIGGGHPFELSVTDQILLTVVWLRTYPTNLVLGFLFEVNEATVSRCIARVLPVLEQDGRDRMRMPDPGRKRRRHLDDLLRETPELAVVIDSFEQRVQRPRERSEADAYYSGKKKSHTLKSQIAVDEESGEIVAVSGSVKGPTADLTLLKQSGFLDKLPEGVGAIGDLAYVGIAKLHPKGLGATGRKKERGQPRSQADIEYNRAFSRRRIIVENSIGRMKRYQSINQTDRQHREGHPARTVAVAGLANRQIRSRLPHFA